MKRLYYLTDDIDRARHIARALERQAVEDRQIHVLTRDEGRLMTRHLHGAGYLDRLDILHRGFQGLLIGLLGGCVLLGVLITSFDWLLDRSAQVALVALTTLLGSWVGGLAGFARENHRLSRFHDAVEQGQHLIMVDVPLKDVARVRSIIEPLHEAVYAGEDPRLAI